MVLFGVYVLVKNGFEMYFFEIVIINGFGVLFGFKFIVNYLWVLNNDLLVIFWLFRILMCFLVVLKFLNFFGEIFKNVIVYIVFYNLGKYKVEKVGIYLVSEFKFNIMEWVFFGFFDLEIMNRLFSRDFFGCKYIINFLVIFLN